MKRTQSWRCRITQALTCAMLAGDRGHGVRLVDVLSVPGFFSCSKRGFGAGRYLPRKIPTRPPRLRRSSFACFFSSFPLLSSFHLRSWMPFAAVCPSVVESFYIRTMFDLGGKGGDGPRSVGRSRRSLVSRRSGRTHFLGLACYLFACES